MSSGIVVIVFEILSADKTDKQCFLKLTFSFILQLTAQPFSACFNMYSYLCIMQLCPTLHSFLEKRAPKSHIQLVDMYLAIGYIAFSIH